MTVMARLEKVKRNTVALKERTRETFVCLDENTCNNLFFMQKKENKDLKLHLFIHTKELF